MSSERRPGGKDTCVGVVGLGYVGFPLAIEFCNRGFEVYGIDVSPEKLGFLTAGKSYIGDIQDSVVAEHISSGRLHVGSKYDLLKNTQAICICVPTPLRKTKAPDMSYVVDAVENIAKVLQPGQLVILESTVYPGATEELIAPILERSGLSTGEDFYLAFSPERVDPGNKEYGLSDIPKIVGGVTPKCTQRVAALYGEIFPRVIPLGSTREAEMAKLLENTFRAVNIGLINELAVSAYKMGINIWNVIRAADSKPFGFMAFYPGPGLGGHCIPIDPFYLSWKAKNSGANTAFIALADKVNTQMPAYVVERVTELLNQAGKPLKGSKILLLGVAYKPNVNDIRESPALDILGLLEQKGTDVSYNDPHAPNLEYLGKTHRSLPLNTNLLGTQDCVLIVTDHSDYDWEFIAQHAKLIFDTRNATKGIRDQYENIELL